MTETKKAKEVRKKREKEKVKKIFRDSFRSVGGKAKDAAEEEIDAYNDSKKIGLSGIEAGQCYNNEYLVEEMKVEFRKAVIDIEGSKIKVIDPWRRTREQSISEKERQIKEIGKQIREEEGKAEKLWEIIHSATFITKEGKCYALLLIKEKFYCFVKLVVYVPDYSQWIIDKETIEDVEKRLIKNLKGLMNDNDDNDRVLKRWFEKLAIDKELKKRSEAVIKLGKKKDVNNILLIGRTGDGRSALANVLLNKNNSFEEAFNEGEYSVSETSEVGSEEFEHEFKQGEIKKVTYRVIDTPGISHTKKELSKEVVLAKIIEEVANSIVCGKLNQVFFVTSGKLTEEEIESYNTLKDIIFDDQINDYTTIVRTNFPNFMNAEEREEDIKRINNGQHEVFGLLKWGDFIHVDNPSLSIGEIPIRSSEENIREIDNSRKERIDINKKIRNFSREKLLKRLENCLDKHYEASEDLKNLSKEIVNSIMEILVLDQKIKEKSQNKELKRFREKRIEALTDLTNKKVKDYIRRRSSNNSFFTTIGSLEGRQIIEKLRDVTPEEVAGTAVKVIDTAAKIAPLGGPHGLAVSLVLGIISGSIKIWLG